MCSPICVRSTRTASSTASWPRAVLRQAAPLRNVLGNDWLLAAAIAVQGKVATTRATAINRELGGTSADFAKLTATLDLPRWQARIPHLVIAGEVFADIGWRSLVYRDLPVRARARLALAAPVSCHPLEVTRLAYDDACVRSDRQTPPGPLALAGLQAVHTAAGRAHGSVRGAPGHLLDRRRRSSGPASAYWLVRLSAISRLR